MDGGRYHLRGTRNIPACSYVRGILLDAHGACPLSELGTQVMSHLDMAIGQGVDLACAAMRCCKILGVCLHILCGDWEGAGSHSLSAAWGCACCKGMYILCLT